MARGLWRLCVCAVTLLAVAGLMWAAQLVANLRYSGEYGVDFFPYGVAITATMAVALLGLLAYALRRRHAWLMCAPLLLSLVGLFFLNGLHEIDAIAAAQAADLRLMREMQLVALPEWRAEHGVYPATHEELRQALRAVAPLRRGRMMRSLHLRAGVALPYEFVVLPNASGPMLSPADARPAVLYYSISRDRQAWWLTMSDACRKAPCRPSLISASVEPIAQSSAAGAHD